MDVASLADLLRETAEHHGSFEAVAPVGCQKSGLGH